MIEYIKSIKRSGKQLTLLSLILLSGGGIAQAQAPDTVFVSFPSSLSSVTLKYGENVEAAAEYLTTSNIQLVCSWHPVTGDVADMTASQLSFAEGKGFIDILKLSVEKPQAGVLGQTVGFMTQADGAKRRLPDVFETKDGSGTTISSPIVYYVNTDEGAVVDYPLVVEKAPLALGMKTYARLYDELNPVSSHISIDSLYVQDNYSLAYDEELKDLLIAAPSPIWDFRIETEVNDRNAASASDVGNYEYQMAVDAMNTISDKLSNYMLVSVSKGEFKVLQDTITITMKGADEHYKTYGEENPVAQFYLTKRIDREGGHSPSGSADNLQENAILTYISGVGSKGFTTEPTFAFKDYEGADVTIKTPATLRKTDDSADSLYVVKVSNTPASLNYHFIYEDGGLRVDKRNLTFNKVIVNREYGELNSDTTWYFEPTNAELQSGLASFDNEQYKVTTNPDFIDKMPLVVIDEAAADKSTNAGEWMGRDVIEIINYVKDPYYFAEDRNYQFDLGIIMPTEADKFDATSVVLNIKKAPLVITLDTIFGSYGEAIPDFNDKDWQYQHPEFISYEGFKLDEWAANLDLEDDWDNQYHQPGDPDGNRIKTFAINGYTPGEVLPIGSYELIGWDYDRYRVNTNYEITIQGRAVYHIDAVNDYSIVWNAPSTTRLVTGQLIALKAKLIDRFGNVLPYQVSYKSEDDQKLKVHTVNNEWYVEALAITQTPVKVTAYFEDPNHLYTEKSYLFEVVRRENEGDFNVIIEESSYTYDGTPKAFRATIKDPLGVETYVPVYEYNGSEKVPTDAGTYNVTIYAEKENTSTHIKVMEEKLVIHKRKVQVQANSVSIIYGQTLPTDYTYTVLPKTDEYGFIGSDGFTLSGKPKVIVEGDVTGAGEYNLTVVGGDPGDNYEMVSIPGKLTVTKAPLVIAADTLSITYGEELPVPTKQITGLVNGDKEEDLRFIYTAKYGTDKDPEDADTYPIVIHCDASNEANYDVQLIPAELTIAKADPKLSLYVPTTTLAGGDTIVVEVSTLSPANITYTMQYDTVATVHKVSNESAKVGGKQRGVTKLYVTVDEDKNYLAGIDSLTFNVTTNVGNESLVLQGVGLYPTLVENNATVVSEMPVDKIYVIDAAGKVQMIIEKPESVIDLGSLSKGYYLVRIVLTNGESKTVRIIKK